MVSTLSAVRQLTNLSRLAQVAAQHPVSAATVGGTALVASNMGPRAEALEGEIMRNRLGAQGGRYVYAELETLDRRKSFFEKCSGEFLKTAQDDPLTQGLIAGATSGVAREGVGGVSKLVRSAGKAIRDKIKLEPQRRRIIEEMSQDPVIQEYELENPGAMEAAYASMKRFAPELSTDPNVARAYLREAAQTGGALNYMTIKQLAETEAAINKAQGRDLK